MLALILLATVCYSHPPGSELPITPGIHKTGCWCSLVSQKQKYLLKAGNTNSGVKTIMLQLNNLHQGTFKIELYNSMGQAVYKTTIVYSGGSLTETIKLPGNIAEGLYHLLVYSGEVRFDQKLIMK